MQAREAAYRILQEIEKGAYANIILDEFLRKSALTALDRRFVTELVYGSVKYQLRLDWLINHLVAKAGKLETGPRLLLRLSFYQLLFLDRVPPSAVTNEGVKLAKKFFNPGVAGLINGVLRNYLRSFKHIPWPKEEDDPARYLEIMYSHPRWMVERWLERYGLRDTMELCKFNNEPADLWVRANTLRITPCELARRLEEEGCTIKASALVPEGINLLSAPAIAQLFSYQEGFLTVQDESSMLVAHAVGPQAGQDILDVCAGPGGKTTHLAQLMDNRGLITACDVHRHRLDLVEENARRMGISIIRTVLQDATEINTAQWPKYRVILVDAPCSGLGVLRRRPDSRWRKSPEDIKALVRIQGQILEKAAALLTPGGRLIYSTCTIEPEENIQVIEELQKNHPDLLSLDLRPFMPYEARDEQEEKDLAGGKRQYLPFRDKMEGFFIAGLKRGAGC